MLRTVFEQPDAASVRAQHRHVVQALEDRYPKAAEHLDEAREDILAFAQLVDTRRSDRAHGRHLRRSRTHRRLFPLADTALAELIGRDIGRRVGRSPGPFHRNSH
ncbi:transposase [Nonomuraea wenchangensis]